jgi:DNA ligase D-like protein (predicted ligase)
MLAKSGKPFDSERHFFEIKWDGFRALSFREGKTLKLWSRNRQDLGARFPELKFLQGLEAGCIVDGEIVILREDGKPDFEAMLGRVKRGSAEQARQQTASYVAFDVLYRDSEPLLDLTLEQRREQLNRLVTAVNHPRLLFSDGVVGHGTALFEEACRQDLEGVIAKRLDSRYLPGKRTDAWTKIKNRPQMLCVILGFLPSQQPQEGPATDFQSLIIASNINTELVFVGQVGSGFSDPVRKKLRRLLHEHRCAQPVVACPLDGIWVEPVLYCTVSYAERTSKGLLRAPVFHELLRES